MNTLQQMPEELFRLLAIVVLSTLFSLCIIVPIIFWRLIKKRPVIPKGEKLQSPFILYLGIALFGGFAAASFIKGMPYFGSSFMIFMSAYVIGLIAYRKRRQEGQVSTFDKIA